MCVFLCLCMCGACVGWFGRLIELFNTKVSLFLSGKYLVLCNY